MEPKSNEIKSNDEYDEFAKEINQVLKEFEKIREWADIGNWIINVHPILFSKKFGNVPHKIRLTKRLAQCLNPCLPAGIHSNALKIYEIILSNYGNKSEMLPLLSVGLFPFFEYSSTELKYELLKIFRSYYIQTPECLQMITSLVNTLLTAFKENNSELNKKIYNFLDEIGEKYGTVWVDGAVWVNILKSEKVRYAGFQYFIKSFADRDKESSGEENEKSESNNSKNSKKNKSEKSPSKKAENQKYSEKENQELQTKKEYLDSKSNSNKYASEKQTDEESIEEKNGNKPRKSSMMERKSEPIHDEQHLETNQSKTPEMYLSEHENSSDEDIKEFEEPPQSAKKKLTTKGPSIESAVSLTSDMMLDEISSDLREEMLQISKQDHGFETRFPHFSTLVVNSLCESLENPNSDNCIRRAALDLINTYIPLKKMNEIEKKDAIVLMTSMLHMINLKEYSSTRRVYTFLFGPPDMKGEYKIDSAEGENNLNILKVTFQNMFTANSKQLSTPELGLSNLNILQTLIEDHPNLKQILLPSLSYQILKFIRVSKINEEALKDFWKIVVEPNSKIFFEGIKSVFLTKEIEKSPPFARDTFFTLEHYYNIKKNMKMNEIIKEKQKTEEKPEDQNNINSKSGNTCNNKDRKDRKIRKEKKESENEKDENEDGDKKNKKENKSEDCEEEENGEKEVEVNENNMISIEEEAVFVIEYLLEYLLKIKCSYQRLSILVINLCHSISSLIQENKAFSASSLSTLDELIKINPIPSIYSKLIILHPQPNKEYLIPFINETSISIVCIKNLLLIPPEKLNSEERQKLFDAIFKLFKCRIWQDQAAEFAEKYREMYTSEFKSLINTVEPSQWIAFWTKTDGKTSDGLIRILEILEGNDKNNKQIIKKWLEDNRDKTENILEPVYEEMSKADESSIQGIYKMIMRIFKAQKSHFSEFFFTNREKYFLPLINKIFKHMEGENESLKVESVDMLDFLLEQTCTLNQKLTFISITLTKTLRNLKAAQENENESDKEIEIISYFMSLVNSFLDFKKDEEKRTILEELIEGEEFFEIVALGMTKTNVIYLKSLYIQLIERSIWILVEINFHERLINKIVKCVTEQIFSALKLNDFTSLEEKMKGENKNKEEDIEIVAETELLENELGIETKYTQVVEYWNCIRFIFTTCVKHKIFTIEISNLLCFVQEYFSMSELKYRQISDKFIKEDYSFVREEIASVTGLKKEIVLLFEILWQNYMIPIVEYFVDKSDPKVLINVNLQAKEVINAILSSRPLQKIKSYYLNQELSLPKEALHYNFDMLSEENKVCYFLYLYFAYCEIKSDENNEELFEKIISVLEIVNLSQHTQTKLWIFEMISGFCVKLDGNKVLTVENKFRNRLDNLIKELLESISPVASKTRIFTAKKYIKTGFFHKFSEEDVEKEKIDFDFIRPFPPTISKQEYLYQNSMKNFGSCHFEHLEDENKHFIFNKIVDLSQEEFRTYLSVVSMKIYTSLLATMLSKFYDNHFEKVESLLKEQISLMFKSYEKEEKDKYFCETFAEFLRKSLLNSSIQKELIKDLKKNVFQIFMSDNFFTCSTRFLNNWKSILDVCTENNDLMKDLLTKEGLFESIFSKTNKTQVQIKNFSRVCFLIYCGKIDKYESKLRVVLESLNKVMKAENPSPALLILILFCLRVLFLRLSSSVVSKMFRSIWPSLIALMIQIFSNKKFEHCINVRLAGLKMIELVDALELEEFNIHKWIFVFDCNFGIILDFGIEIEEQSEKEKEFNEDNKLITPFKFQPILSKILRSQPLKCTFKPLKYEKDLQNGARKILIYQSSISSEEELEKLGKELLNYMIESNEHRLSVDREEIEKIIEEDFIYLDVNILNDEEAL